MSDFAAVGRQRVGRLYVFEEYGALRGPDEGGPVGSLPCFVVYPEFSKRALLNGNHGSPLSRKPMKHHYHKPGSVRKGTREGRNVSCRLAMTGGHTKIANGLKRSSYFLNLGRVNRFAPGHIDGLLVREILSYVR